jgi:hypothetical protein
LKKSGPAKSNVIIKNMGQAEVISALSTCGGSLATAWWLWAAAPASTWPRAWPSPPALAALGVTEGVFNRVIDGALADHCHRTSPREASRDDYRGLLRELM